jgi:DNA-binding response OmpR family regulator
VATILVVDDDPAIRLLLRMELNAEGHDVLEAGDGAEAIERMAQWSPELVLLDLMMPGVDGWQVLRSLDGRIEPPVVIISAKPATGSHVAEALELGAIDYVPKPFDAGHIAALCDAVLKVDATERAEYRRIKLALANAEG